MKILLALSLLIVSALAQSTSPYCKVCTNHVACLNPTNAWASTCPAGPPKAAMATLNANLTTLIVDRHNYWRNQLAIGNISVTNAPVFTGKLKPATNMMKLKYNAEMATIASYNVKQCAMNHDACRNLLNGQYSGQNLYSAGWSGTAPADIAAHLKQAIANWFSEFQYANQAVLDVFGASPTAGKAIGHFTQVGWAVNTEVGCAVSTYFSGGFNRVLVACNYGPGNMLGQSVYVSGIVASKCVSKDTVYEGLCTA